MPKVCHQAFVYLVTTTISSFTRRPFRFWIIEQLYGKRDSERSGDGLPAPTLFFARQASGWRGEINFGPFFSETATSVINGRNHCAKRSESDELEIKRTLVIGISRVRCCSRSPISSRPKTVLPSPGPTRGRAFFPCLGETIKRARVPAAKIKRVRRENWR